MLSGAVTSLPTSKPGSISRAACRLRTKSPAAMRSSSDSATSATTSILLEAEPASASVAVAGRILERRHQPRPRRLERRRDAKHDPGEERQREREQQHARVDREVERERQRALRRRRRLERPDDDPRQRNAGDAADRRQQHAFGQQLPDEAPAARADGQPHRELAPPRRGPRQQQVRDVRAGDQQHGADDAAEQQRDRPHLLPLIGIALDRSARARARRAPPTGSRSARTSSRPWRAPRAPVPRCVPGRSRPNPDSQPLFGFLSRSGFCSPE